MSEADALCALAARPFLTEGRFAVWRGSDEWMTAPLALARDPQRITRALASEAAAGEGEGEGEGDAPGAGGLRRIARGARQDVWRDLQSMRGVVPAARMARRGSVVWLTLWAAALDGAALPVVAQARLHAVTRRWAARGWTDRVLRPSRPPR